LKNLSGIYPGLSRSGSFI